MHTPRVNLTSPHLPPRANLSRLMEWQQSSKQDFYRDITKVEYTMST